MQTKETTIIAMTTVFLCFSGYGARLDKVVDSKEKAERWLREQRMLLSAKGFAKRDIEDSLKFYEYRVQ